MNKKRTCPICEKGCTTIEEFNCVDGGIPSLSFNCKPIGRTFYLDQRIIGMYGPKEQFFYTAIVNDLLRRNCTDRRIPHYCYNTVPKTKSKNDVYVDVNEMPLWGFGHVEKMDQSLLNLYLLYGENVFDLDTILSMRCMLCTDRGQALAMENSLIDFGYITRASSTDRPRMYIISKEGWNRLDELGHNRTNKTGFVAISFDDKTTEIREVLKRSISRCGFKPIVMDEVEHNNQIVPEIENQIKKCEFLVMDCSVSNSGAYLESGMAMGFGKEVIISCKKEIFDNEETEPHFDIKQHSMILWKDLDDLEEKLVKRILHTVEGAKESKDDGQR